MATLIFSAVGTLIGGPIGGAIGALVGRQVDTAIIGGGHQEGPRLKELTVTTSSYGTALPRYFGRMRVPGSIIWATELVEHTQTQSGGKSRPSVTTYNYTASFAVALASRRIADIGRIWADGNLLRGEAGDLKVAGTMRFYQGDHDQSRDPLISAIEGSDRCPAFRGLSYVVFEDLELGDFFNRIPSLTFEVVADPGGFGLQQIVGEVVDEADARLGLPGLQGFACEGPLADTLTILDPIFPMDCDASSDQLILARERLQSAPLLVSEPAITVEDGEFGGKSGFARKREPGSVAPPEVLRYYDIARDFQPGLQRAAGRPGPGQPRTIELPATLDAETARDFAQRASRQSHWGREKIAWRTHELDPLVAPGAIVALPGQPGRWRVTGWEWRESGIELALDRTVPQGLDLPPALTVDPGRFNPPADLPPPPSALVAFELPWDGLGDGAAPALFAAVSSSGANWSGAALYADHGNGELQPLGVSGRNRAIIGSAETALPPAQPVLFDRTASVTIVLLDAGMNLLNATSTQLAQGANRALLGSEIIQFAFAEPLDPGRWRLTGLLRGRGGTERAVSSHTAGETFVLLDARPIALDASVIGDVPETQIVALGRGDSTAIASPIAMRGITRRPLPPVHPCAVWLEDGGLELGWTRRARGAWQWLDGVDTPLIEQSQNYLVSFGPLQAPIGQWSVSEPHLVLGSTQLAQLAASLPGGAFNVRQQGSFALSDPLCLTSLP